MSKGSRRCAILPVVAAFRVVGDRLRLNVALGRSGRFGGARGAVDGSSGMRRRRSTFFRARDQAAARGPLRDGAR